MTQAEARIAAVLIGRNEGDRLERCLASVCGQVARVIYVDSGSTDNSLERARHHGAEVVELATDQPFTAARARNAGLAVLTQASEPPDFVQFLDGDCELRSGWLTHAAGFLQTHPKAAVACGRRRERFPEASVYNRLIDQEWDTPVGRALACGGDALMRMAALQEVGGFNPALIAGEEPELCVRLRQAGWTVWRLDHEMTWHDAAITRFSQWWTRARRAGHAYAEGAYLHGAAPEQHKVAATRRAMIWGAAVPALAVILPFFSPWGFLVLLAWLAQMVRMGLKSGDWVQSGYLMLSKIPEMQGVLSFYWRHLTGQTGHLIEYK